MSSMRTWIKITGSLLVLLLLGVVLAISPKGDRDGCIDRAPQRGQKQLTGYELIDIARGEVWVTADWAPETFADFSLPRLWVTWLKNDPRVTVADTKRFLKSPGCSLEGQFTYMQAFGRDFFQVVQLKQRRMKADDEGLIRKVLLEKYHLLGYAKGKTVSLLNSPAGDRYILVATTLNRTSEPTIPPGWSLTTHLLAEDLQVELFGDVEVLRLDNEDSYQGPLPEGMPF